MPVAQLIASRELLWNLTLRELRTKYRRSFLGWFWSLLNPLSTVVIYGYVFGTIMQAPRQVGDPSGIENYSLYLLCALLPWNFFSLSINFGMTSLVGNAALVRRVAFPRETLVFAQVLHGLVQFAIELAILTVILVIFGGGFGGLVYLPFTALLMLLLAVFAAGLGLALSAVNVYFRDMSYLWAIVMQAWFFATPIVYPRDTLEGRVPEWALTILDANPMAQFCEGFRRVLYDWRAPGLWSTTALAVMSVVTLVAGWSIFTKLSRRFAEEL